MDIKTLQYFTAIVETGSITKAAQREFISQPALSRRLAELEQELGLSLLERTTRSLSLTPAGQICYDSAKRILREREAMLLALRQNLKGLEGKISIWCTWMLELQISSFLSELSRTMPKLEIQFTQQNNVSAEEELDQGRLDIMIGPHPPQVDAAKVESSFLFHSQYCAVLPRHHALAEKNTVLLQELSGMPLILLGTKGTESIEGRILAMCEERGFAYSGLVYANNLGEQQLLSAMGKGVAFLPEIAKERTLGNLRFIPIKDCTLQASYACLWRKDNKNPILPIVLRLLRDWREAFLRSSEHFSQAGLQEPQI